MRIRFIPFDKLPYADTCWALIEGPDERVYVAACCERSSGGTVYLLRYDPRTEQLEYLLSTPSLVTVHTLEARLAWAPIRNHPAFRALMEKYR